jgi:para-nitrobenzyl esterase
MVFAASLGSNSVESLRTVSAQTLIEHGATSEVPGLNLPNIDGYVLPRDVRFALTALTDAPKIDLMVGIDAQEGATIIDEPMSAHAYTVMVQKRYGNLSHLFLTRFPARSEAEAASSQVRLETADVAWRTFTWARDHTKVGTGRTYGYVFARVPPWSAFTRLNAAGHGAELPYLFGYPPRLAFFVKRWPWSAVRDVQIADQLQSYWTNFAKTGDPNGVGLPAWTPFTSHESVLTFSDSTSMEELPERADLALMDAHWLEIASAQPDLK